MPPPPPPPPSPSPSPSRLALSKLHGGGNDFLVLVDLEERFGRRGEGGLSGATVAALCERATGVGADGLIRLLPGTGGAHCAMELWNADGGEAEMSGNGIRCLAAVAARCGLGEERVLDVDTAAGRRRVELRRGPGGDVVGATVDMGVVAFAPTAIPVEAADPLDLEVDLDGRPHRAGAAGLGNPHLVVLVEDPRAVDVARHGPRLEHDRRFPNRANVSFVAVVGGGLSSRVWERGVGETRSCGTGACAAAAVARRLGLVGDEVEVRLPGGPLRVELGATARLSGPVAAVFEAEVDLDRLLGRTSGPGGREAGVAGRETGQATAVGSAQGGAGRVAG